MTMYLRNMDRTRRTQSLELGQKKESGDREQRTLKLVIKCSTFDA